MKCICGNETQKKYCPSCSENLLKTRGRDRTRLAVRIRDKFTCQSCAKKWKSGRHFDVHHREGLCGKNSRGYDSIALIPFLVTLCHRCHFAQHDFSKNSYSKRVRKFDWQEAAKLRRAGLTYDAIAKKMNMKYASVYRAVKSYAQM